ncbi:hypothetical protein, partial [Caulobacter sp. Root342]|uniref:hypothetical protein n=1 Tax=Caulobacter sp. Root342 TaxID=1736519 RepID=UPI001F3F07D1
IPSPKRKCDPPIGEGRLICRVKTRVNGHLEEAANSLFRMGGFDLAGPNASGGLVPPSRGFIVRSR